VLIVSPAPDIKWRSTEPPDTEPYVRWCGRTAEANPSASYPIRTERRVLEHVGVTTEATPGYQKGFFWWYGSPAFRLRLKSVRSMFYIGSFPAKDQGFTPCSNAELVLIWAPV
jgi:hypothetical protein